MKSLPKLLIGSALALGMVGAAHAEGGPDGGLSGPGGQGARPPRAPPSEGGTVGVVDDLTPGTIEIVMSSGQKATLQRTSLTVYKRGANTIASNTIAKGDTVLVLGIVHNIQGQHKTDIDATLVLADSPGVTFVPGSDVNNHPGGRRGPGGGPGGLGAGGGQPPEKKVGAVPADYVEGAGTIVGPAEADKAILAAFAAYPNGLINRVVKVNGGVYEVHHIGVNWPHHIFITTNDFKYVGAF